MKLKFFQSTASTRDLPGLEPLTDAERTQVLEAGRVVHIPGDWAPIRKQEPAGEAYLVLEGVMRVDDGEDHLADIGPGGFAGEMGLVDHRLRNARVVTSGDVVALAIPKREFEALRRDIPAFDTIVTESTQARRGLQ
jgi:CRP/FNR family cyclic AMP-dependent transcriptional regulator